MVCINVKLPRFLSKDTFNKLDAVTDQIADTIGEGGGVIMPFSYAEYKHGNRNIIINFPTGDSDKIDMINVKFKSFTKGG